MNLKPITILIGKNSSGKSSVAKLFTLLSNSLSGKIEEPLFIKNNGVELGAEFRDLTFNRNSTPITFEVAFKDNNTLKCSIVKDGLNYNLDIVNWAYKGLELSYTPSNGFRDPEGKEYKCEFNGFVPTKIKDENGNNVITDYLIEAPVEVDYIGPFRILPERQFYLTGQINYPFTGIKGENAYSMLGVSKMMKTELHENVGKWFEDHFDGWQLEVKDNMPFFEINLKKGGADINIVDVGQGMNQALPLIVRAHVTNMQDSIIVLEQPELHLHPAAHGDMAELFAFSAKSNNQTFIIETHSENILLRLRRLIIQNSFGFKNDDLVIYWIDDNDTGGRELREITVDELGVLSDWPEGVFNENLKEILEMQKALNPQ